MAIIIQNEHNRTCSYCGNEVDFCDRCFLQFNNTANICCIKHRSVGTVHTHTNCLPEGVDAN